MTRDDLREAQDAALREGRIDPNARYGAVEIEENSIEVLRNPAAADDYMIYWHFPEFTSLCPRSGFPDFAAVHIWWVPRDYILELKSLKLYFNGFRNRSEFHERVSLSIFETLVTLAEPKWLRLWMDWSPRGNLYTGITLVHAAGGYEPSKHLFLQASRPSWRAGADAAP